MQVSRKRSIIRFYNNMRIIFCNLLILIFLVLTTYLSHGSVFRVDARSDTLCKWYANLNHEKEIVPERWKWGKEWMVKFDWYNSCVNHIKYPVARK